MKSKKNKNILGIILITINVVFILGFTIYQSLLVQEEKQMIIGTWILDNDSTNKWIFTSNNTCKWESEGVVTDEFTYTITSEITTNDNELTFLEIVHVSDVSMVFGYSINSLTDDKMTLEHSGGFGTRFSEYTKQ